ncbi:hypothetical protein SDJN02_08178, partial [Cucurbita argyrosperma subsp. argyrosperma]
MSYFDWQCVIKHSYTILCSFPPAVIHSSHQDLDSLLFFLVLVLCVNLALLLPEQPRETL